MDRTFLGRQGEDVSPCHDENPLAVRGEAETRQGAAYLAVFAAAVDVIVREGDADFLGLASLADVVFVDVTSVLEDYPVLRAGRELAVILGEIGDLACLLAAGVIDEEVHRPVAVREVVDLIPHPHREDVLGVVVCDFLQTGGADSVDPDVVGLPSAIVFPCAELAEHPVHREFAPVRRVGAEASLGGRDDLRGAAFGSDLAEIAAQPAETVLLAAVDYLAAVRSPAHHDIVGTHTLADLIPVDEGRVGDPAGFAASEGHRVYFRITVVLARERYGLAVW